MLAVGSRLFFYKNIAQLLLRNFADNPHKYKANFLWRLSTNLTVFIVCEANYSYQFYYFIKKCPNDIHAGFKCPHEERTDNICYIFL